MAAAKKKKTTLRKETHHTRSTSHPPPPLRAWHVVLSNGADQTVTANECSTYDGVLTFFRHPDDEPAASDQLRSDAILVRAFSPQSWREVELVDTPTPVHAPPDLDA